MDLSPAEEFVLEDSSSSDNSDGESLLENHQRKMVVAVLAIKELEDGMRKRRPGSKVGCLCIPHNQLFGNELLIWDYFAEVPMYLAHLFR